MALPELPDGFGNFAVAGLEHLAQPGAIALWPPAPGWWVLGALTLLSLALLAWKRWRRWQRNRYRREALAGLRACRSLAPERQLVESARLLKAAALAAFPRPEIAALSGEAWLDWLDRNGPGFSDSSRQLLARGQYRVAPELDSLDGLAVECERWVREHREAAA